MKKLYLIAAIAAISCSSAFAAQLEQAKPMQLANINTELEPAANVEANSSKSMKSAAKATMRDFNNTYNWGFKSLLNSSPNPELTIAVVNENTGYVKIMGFPQDFMISGYINLTTNTLTIPNNQNLGSNSYGDNWCFYLKPVVEGKVGAGVSDAASTVGVINGSTITFPATDVWAIGNPENEDMGFWCMTYMNILTVKPEKVLYGTGTVSGDMYFSPFGVTPADYEVEVYTDPGDEVKKLLVKDPLKGLYAALDITGVSPDMLIDCTDRDNVVIPSFWVGIDGREEGGTYYGFSQSANYQDPASTPAEYRITFEEGEQEAVITFPYRSMFLWPTETNTLTYANDDVVTITIPREQGAVKVIGDSNADVEVEYYNLQGMRVANPTAGQIMIKKQGNKVEKLMN